MSRALFDLNGRWIDIIAIGVPEITITHDLDTNLVQASYDESRRCTDPNGVLLGETKFNLEGTLQGDQLEGKINVCNFGERVPTQGWVLEQLKLIVSPDGRRLDGRYFCRVDRNWVPVAITRQGYR